MRAFLRVLLAISIINGVGHAFDDESKSLRVMTYNVLCGFHHRNQTDAGVNWISTQAPDVLALQELNEFSDESFSALSNRWGHSHSVLQKTTGYSVGITSKEPIETIEQFVDPSGHGFLHVQITAIDFLVIHLHPGDYKKRRVEGARIVERVESILSEGRRLVLLGDFNTHSLKDEVHLKKQTHLLKRRAGANLIDEMFDFKVIEMIEATGLIDACYAKRSVGAPWNSFPTRTLDHVKTKEDQALFLERIDFIFLSPNLATHCNKAYVGRDPVLEEISDHYPVVVEFEVGDSSR